MELTLDWYQVDDNDIAASSNDFIIFRLRTEEKKVKDSNGNNHNFNIMNLE
ncbi:hypothetical protein [Bacillus sp. FJAT-29937]|uniref:hypothetical protein n=1 Tax=Bacillus sp. FJAT-29937 TaxID=1720553 RepID=UPI000AF59255|nr:hypothetical protein [Bacillus sp. FJAT-29937]